MASQKTNDDPTAATDAAASDCCSPGHSLSEAAVAADVETLATLGNDTRYEALRLIAGSGDGVCVCELEPNLGVSQGAEIGRASCRERV